MKSLITIILLLAFNTRMSEEITKTFTVDTSMCCFIYDTFDFVDIPDYRVKIDSAGNLIIDSMENINGIYLDGEECVLINKKNKWYSNYLIFKKISFVTISHKYPAYINNILFVVFITLFVIFIKLIKHFYIEN